MNSRNLKLEITPSQGYVLSRKINEKWEFYYTIGGPLQSRCKICGYPLKDEEICNHHQGLENLNLNYLIHFVGYYQTDFNGNPMNKFTKRIIKMRLAEGEKYYQELLLILNSLFKTIKKKHNIKWGSWVPTSNNLLLKVARNLILSNNLILINPLEIIEIDDQINGIENKEDYVKKKYKLNEKYNPKIYRLINNDTGIIFDDLLHTGYTIGRIFKIFQEFQPKKLIGLVFVRTSRGKHPLYLKYPNFP